MNGTFMGKYLDGRRVCQLRVETPSLRGGITMVMDANENIFSVGDESGSAGPAQDPYAQFCDAYLEPVILRRKWELVIDEVGPQNSNVFEFPLFNQAFCDMAIGLAEERNAWMTDRHRAYPAVDVELGSLGIGEMYTRVIHDFVAPIAKSIWSLEGGWVDQPYAENFMIRYRKEDQNHLYLHHDWSHWTMGVRLNGEFEGGGTYFQRLGMTMTPKRNGNAFIHPGMVTHRHGARPVWDGTRYILISFIRAAQNAL